jgi:tetratricopeptide (TPR) repeat protein
MEQKSEVSRPWTKKQAFGMALLCLILGSASGYLLRASSSVTPPKQIQIRPPQPGDVNIQDHLKKMVEKKAEPLLAKLQQNPNDVATLTDLGNLYYAAKQYDTGIMYLEKSSNLKPDANTFTQLGIGYYYSGAPDKAVASLNRALQLDPKFANAWFDLGVIKWQAMADSKGAIASWEQLLKTNPTHPRRAEVEKMIAKAKEHNAMPSGQPGKAAN